MDTMYSYRQNLGGGVSSYILLLKTASGYKTIQVDDDHGLLNLQKWRRMLRKAYRYADNWACSFDDMESLDRYMDICAWELGWVQDPVIFYERYNGRPNSNWVQKEEV